MCHTCKKCIETYTKLKNSSAYILAKVKRNPLLIQDSNNFIIPKGKLNTVYSVGSCNLHKFHYSSKVCVVNVTLTHLVLVSRFVF